MDPRISVPSMPAVDAFGAVDLDMLPCTGCVYANSKQQCKRFPPVFVPPYPEKQPNGEVRVIGGWAFPPAIAKCGEFTRKDG